MNHYAKREQEKPLFVRIMYWCICLVLLLMFLLLFWVPMNAQERSNTYYVSQFQGADVGAKTTNAQAACSPNASLPCIIVFDSILAAWPQGSLPARCAQCLWLDYTSLGGMKITPLVSSPTILSMVQDVDPPGVAGSDILYASSVGNQWRMKNNGGAADNVVGVNLAAIFTNKTFDTAGTGNVLKIGGGTVPATKGTANQALVMDGTGTNLTFITLPTSTGVAYSTASSPTTASIGATTMATAGAAGNTYRFSVYVDQTALGASCTGNTTVNVQLVFTDPNAAGATTLGMASISAGGIVTITTNGTVGFITTGVMNQVAFRAKASTTVQYQTVYALGTGCSPGPQYQVYPILELLS